MKINIYVFIVAFVILAFSSVAMTIDIATSNLEVSRLEKTEAELLSQSNDFEDSLARVISISSLQDKSGGLGFIKPTNMVYVSQAEPVAKLP